MDKNNKIILRAYIEAARKKLKSAKILFENGSYDDCVSRAYYSVFHCAQSLLISKGLKAETHYGVKLLFGLHFIKTNIFDKKYAKYLKNLKDDREDSDYGIFTLIEKEDAENSIKEAEEFLKETEKYLKIK